MYFYVDTREGGFYRGACGGKGGGGDDYGMDFGENKIFKKGKERKKRRIGKMGKEWKINSLSPNQRNFFNFLSQEPVKEFFRILVIPE